MLCMTCKIDVPPAFKLAIEKNQCPGCWGPILDEKHQELLKELAEAMSKMEGDPQGLAGWLISTFHIEKRGVIEPTIFHDKPKENIKIANNPFLKNAGVEHLVNQKKYKNLLAQISSDKTEIVEQNTEENEVSEEIEMDPKNSILMTNSQEKPLTPAELSQFNNLLKPKLKEPDLHPALNEARRLRLEKQQDALSGLTPSKIIRS